MFHLRHLVIYLLENITVTLHLSIGKRKTSTKSPTTIMVAVFNCQLLLLFELLVESLNPGILWKDKKTKMMLFV